MTRLDDNKTFHAVSLQTDTEKMVEIISGYTCQYFAEFLFENTKNSQCHLQLFTVIAYQSGTWIGANHRPDQSQ